MYEKFVERSEVLRLTQQVLRATVARYGTLDFHMEPIFSGRAR